ncbi:ligase-associated DNA damage response endonuclease PdeM [Pedobacter gandavensis]|uniref:ligase-associated DNA damage response endonuclease PdeM n=1 Tax=Pedobacter gandavensis TaxID=2679963 RepID=UPI0029315B94|nr:ligase-associated DNA damage response endonuclease PdeM [Pedobacter gandavensis]
MIVNCRSEELILSKDRAIYWKSKALLIISDLHIGKSAHFRKNGIPVPNLVGLTDFQRLNILIKEFNPGTLVITGDMFHNNINSDAIAFQEWRSKYPHLKIILVKGNHDDLKKEDYEAFGIEVYTKELLIPPFRFIHDKPHEIDAYYNISGHLHPGVVIYGKARQRLKFPCFYFGAEGAIMPAFSVFTGLKILTPETGDRFYVITPDKVIPIIQ